MTPHDQNGRIKMTWAQFAWGITMLLMIAGMWSRMETRMALLEVAISSKASTAEVSDLRARIFQFVPEAGASVKQ